MNEMEPQEIAESLEYQFDHTISMPDKDRAALEQGAIYMHKIASGELAEVVHAHWTGGYTHKGDVWAYTQPQCSNCHNTIIGGTTKFCPNCGALMDGKDGNNDSI